MRITSATFDCLFLLGRENCHVADHMFLHRALNIIPEPIGPHVLSCKSRAITKYTLAGWPKIRSSRFRSRHVWSIHGRRRSIAHLGRSGAFLRFCWGDFGACCGRPGFQSLIEPHRQRDPTALWVGLQHFDADDIAGLRNFAWVLDVSIGHRRDVQQPVLMAPNASTLVTTPSRTMPG